MNGIVKVQETRMHFVTKIILTNANFAGYNWTEINALSVNSNLHAQDITSLQ